MTPRPREVGCLERGQQVREALVGSTPAHSGASGEGTMEAAREARLGESSTHLSWSRSSAARQPRHLLRGPQGGGDAKQSAQPGAHTRPRAGILPLRSRLPRRPPLRLGGRFAQPSGTREPGASLSFPLSLTAGLLQSPRRSRLLLSPLSLSSPPVWGNVRPAPPAPLSPLPLPRPLAARA